MGGGVSVGERGELVVSRGGLLKDVCESRRPITVTRPRPGMCSIEVLEESNVGRVVVGGSDAADAAASSSAGDAADAAANNNGAGNVDGVGGSNGASPFFAIGDLVQLIGLQAGALNGRVGSVVSGLNNNQRYDVALGGDEDGGRVVAVRPINLRPTKSCAAPPTDGDDRGPLAGIARLNAAGELHERPSPPGAGE